VIYVRSGGGAMSATECVTSICVVIADYLSVNKRTLMYEFLGNAGIYIDKSVPNMSKT